MTTEELAMKNSDIAQRFHSIKESLATQVASSQGEQLVKLSNCGIEQPSAWSNSWTNVTWSNWICPPDSL